MPYLIDSDWLIDHLAEAPDAIELLDTLMPEGLFISVASYMEAFQGTLREGVPESSIRRLHLLVNNAPVLSMDIAIAERCARIRQHLLEQGKRPTRRGFDVVVAATALEYSLTLVTRNVRDYAGHPRPQALRAVSGLSRTTAGRPSLRFRS